MIQKPLNLSDYEVKTDDKVVNIKVDKKLDSKIEKNKEKELNSLLLTSKELKIIRRKAKEEKVKKQMSDIREQTSELKNKHSELYTQQSDEDDDIIEDDDDVEYERIKSKLDNINELELDLPPIETNSTQQSTQIPPRTVQNTQNTSIPNQSITVLSNSNVPNLVQPRQSHEAGRVIQNQVSSPPMDDSGDVDLNKLFSSEVGNESDVVKELFTQDNIKVKTDISPNEISIISRLELQASMTQNFFLTKVLKELEVLRVSKNRMSRGEFVQSFSGIRESNSGATAFGKLSGIFKNDKV
jgi:hypothetical protein